MPIAPSPDMLPKLTAELLASLAPAQHKQIIGDHLYARIEV